jgi:hypothetical protein
MSHESASSTLLSKLYNRGSKAEKDTSTGQGCTQPTPQLQQSSFLFTLARDTYHHNFEIDTI